MLFSKTILNGVEISPIFNNRPIIMALLLLSVGIKTLHAEEANDTLSTVDLLTSSFPHLITGNAEQTMFNIEQVFILNKENGQDSLAMIYHQKALKGCDDNNLAIYYKNDVLHNIANEMINKMEYKKGMRYLFDIAELEKGENNKRHLAQSYLSTRSEALIISKLIMQSINAYRLKNTKKNELLIAVKTILGGENYLSKEVRDIYNEASFKSDYSPIPKLSKREQEILKLIGDQFTREQFAEILFISKNTVEYHSKNMFSKLNVKNVAGLIKTASKNNLLEC